MMITIKVIIQMLILMSDFQTTIALITLILTIILMLVAVIPI